MDIFNSINQHLEKVPYFVSVVRCGSIQKASQEIGIAQPSLSKSIKILEESLGSELLIRSRNGVEMTNAGRVLFSFGQDLMCRSIETLDTIKKGDLTSPFRIGTHEIILANIWPRLSKKVNSTFSTHISIQELYKKLEHFIVEAIIVPESKSIDVKKNFAHTKLYDEAYGFYYSNEFEKQYGSKKRISEQNLSDLPFVFFERSIAGKSKTIREALDRKKINISSIHDVGSHESAINLAFSGLGATILPRKTGQFYVNKKLLKEIPIENKILKCIGSHSVFLVFLKSRDKSQRMDSLRKFVSTI